MKQFSYVLTRTVAPHARPMVRLVREGTRFSSCIQIRKDTAVAVLRKVSDLIRLNLKCGNRITVIVEGKDEEAAVAAISDCIAAYF